MKSTIRVKQDWDKNEPYIQLKLDTANPNEEVDLADSTLIHFVQQANIRGIELNYTNGNTENSMPQIRLKNPTSFEEVKDFYLKQLDIFAKAHFKANDYKNWENIYNLFCTDCVRYGQ